MGRTMQNGTNGLSLLERKRILRQKRLKRRDKLKKLVEQYEQELNELKTTYLDRGSSPRLSSGPSSPRSPSAASVVIDARPRQSLRHELASSAAVKQEAQILARVTQLQQEGLWSQSKLKAVTEPPVAKVHWGYVIEEMNWLQSVIKGEVKNKKENARKCSRMVQKYFQDKILAERRAEKMDEANRRKIASFMAKEVRTFWANVEKLFEFRLKSQIDMKRKQALDEHLNMIVDKTEKYSTLLAESLATQNSSLKTTPNVSDEEMSVSSYGGRSAKNDREYEPDMSSDDDEETIAKDDDVHDEGEIDMLSQEADIPIEDLLRKFHPELYDQESTEASGEAKNETSEKPSKRGEKAKAKSEEADRETDKDNLKALVEEDPNLFDAVETAEAFQPTGNTLDTTTVKTPVPFLLKHTLREYQHIGLDWLVSLHERSFNGILADEMGLGKTIQTIALLAHLACSKGVWGPHLIVVPTSVMLNWEMEIKKWCPAFKVLTYFGTQKERRMKRVGWTKKNAFHICITSYKLVIQDHQSFRRKQWYYFILDEAQHIKNFKSQRWQLLLNFQSEGRLLLTGTPLQNNLMELWSLMHFLMPNVFQSHRNFKEWFSNPMTGMVEDSQEYNDGLVRRLHKVLRPFLLRRLKNEVEKQLPKKYEHVVYCSLSKRQRYLYDDFMSRAKTKETLSGGNFMSVINCLMQLRKVCNHPNLFEPRPTLSPFIPEPLDMLDGIPKLAHSVLKYDPLNDVDLAQSPLNLLTHELWLSGWASYSGRRLQNRYSKDVPAMLDYKAPPTCPKGKFRMIIRYNAHPAVNASAHIPLSTIINNNIWIKRKADLNIRTEKGTFLLTPCQSVPAPSPFEQSRSLEPLSSIENGNGLLSPKRKRRSTGVSDKGGLDGTGDKPRPKGIFTSALFAKTKVIPSTIDTDKFEAAKESLESHIRINQVKIRASPLYGMDLLDNLRFVRDSCDVGMLEHITCKDLSQVDHHTVYDLALMKSKVKLNPIERLFLTMFHLYVPTVITSTKSSRLEVPLSLRSDLVKLSQQSKEISPLEFNLQLPEARLIQYDCGKLQTLGKLLHKLKTGGHRVLLFTQMTKVLDILEAFLNYHGYIYLRLDGSTRIEQRQVLMERFNNSSKYFCFILSTRSGGVGINLTGADTVIFYDSDWNPTMDAQAQDRCHRIGQTRDVHIYRLVSERTVEENILKKANQKRLLGDLAIDGGNFTTAHLKAQTIRDLFDLEGGSGGPQDTVDADDNNEPVVDKKSMGAFESAIAAVEDATDTEAMMKAKREALAEEAEFDEDPEKAGLHDDDGFGHLVSQLSAVERYALAHIEFLERDWRIEQLTAADQELAAQKQHLEEQHRQEMAELEASTMAERQESSSSSSEEEEEDSDDDSDDDDDEEDDEDE